tara:strand:+ start:750 stop:1145 length:396 start_codon:yes stop_codon:yes gene_type:complete
MTYSVNHVHIRAKDPDESAKWYEEFFDAKILSSREVMPGTITVSMDAGGPVRLNISSQPEGSSDNTVPAELNRLGLEHFGFDTTDIEFDIRKFESAGVRIVLPITEISGGTKLAYIEGPDKVLIELVQSVH